MTLASVVKNTDTLENSKSKTRNRKLQIENSKSKSKKLAYPSVSRRIWIRIRIRGKKLVYGYGYVIWRIVHNTDPSYSRRSPPSSFSNLTQTIALIRSGGLYMFN